MIDPAADWLDHLAHHAPTIAAVWLTVAPPLAGLIAYLFRHKVALWRPRSSRSPHAPDARAVP